MAIQGEDKISTRIKLYLPWKNLNFLTKNNFWASLSQVSAKEYGPWSLLCFVLFFIGGSDVYQQPLAHQFLNPILDFEPTLDPSTLDQLWTHSGLLYPALHYPSTPPWTHLGTYLRPTLDTPCTHLGPLNPTLDYINNPSTPPWIQGPWVLGFWRLDQSSRSRVLGFGSWACGWILGHGSHFIDESKKYCSGNNELEKVNQLDFIT